MKSKKTIQSLTLIVGSLLAVMVICIQSLNVGEQPLKSEVKTEQQESSQTEGPVVSIASFSIPTPVHVTINLDAYCLFEILFEQKAETNASAEAPLHPEKFFTTLFRVIISPNAP